MRLITNVDNIKINCPVCKNEDVSILEINDSLPSDLKSYFKPFPNQIEIFFANAQFQFVGMLERLEFQHTLISKANMKNTKLRDLLQQAKKEISLMEELKYTNNLLKQENSRLTKEISDIKRSLQSSQVTKQQQRPDTVDLTIDSTVDSSVYGQPRKEISLQNLVQSQQSNKRKNIENGHGHNHESFVEKIQKFSSMKRLPTNITVVPQEESTSIKSFMKRSMSSSDSIKQPQMILSNLQSNDIGNLHSDVNFNPNSNSSSSAMAARNFSLSPITSKNASSSSNSLKSRFNPTVRSVNTGRSLSLRPPTIQSGVKIGRSISTSNGPARNSILTIKRGVITASSNNQNATDSTRTKLDGPGNIVSSASLSGSHFFRR